MEEIKQLRERTGAGMVDCKKALEEAGNDIEKAIEILRKKGIAKAAKRAEREAKEGVIKVITNEAKTTGYILELNSETDFVARNEKFQEFGNQALELAKDNQTDSLETLIRLNLNGLSLQDSLASLSGVIGEKLGFGRYAVLKGESVGSYSHLGGMIAVLVALDKPGKTELANDIAMHIAAANPRYLNPEDVNPEELAKEEAIYREQLVKEGKPENIMENIMKGKVAKFYNEVCLTKQEYIKDDKKKVEEILGDAKIVSFIRYSL
jgi:elongation factor Ts